MTSATHVSMIRRGLLLAAALLITAWLPAAFAGTPYEATLAEMAEQADHILVGRVTGVDMIDGQGQQVTDENARTGPGLDNTIRLLVKVDEVFVSNAERIPDTLALPLASHLHYSLGQVRTAHSGNAQKQLLLLKGSDFSGIKPGVFLRPIEDKEEAMRTWLASHPEGKVGPGAPR